MAYPPRWTAPIYFDNHSSSRLDPSFISTYIADEQAAGRYSEAFSPSELEARIGHFITSPLGLVPKPNSSKLRMIQDLSFPRADPSCPSVNSFINSDDFPTAWGTFEETAKLILSLPEGCRTATFNISAAYRITPVHPLQQNFVCVLWQGKVYVDRAVCFGLASSAGVFGRVADMLVAICKAAGFCLIVKWVDDFMVFALPTDTWTEDDFVAVTSQLGVPWAQAKTRPLAFVQRYIGFDWDLRARSVSLPEEKRAAILRILGDWLVEDAKVSVHDSCKHVRRAYMGSLCTCRPSSSSSALSSGHCPGMPTAFVLTGQSWRSLPRWCGIWNGSDTSCSPRRIDCLYVLQRRSIWIGGATPALPLV